MRLAKVEWLIVVLLLFKIHVFANETSIKSIYESEEISDDEKLDSLYVSFFDICLPQEQVKYADQLINLAKTNSDEYWLFRGYYIKANALYFMGEPEKASINYFKCLEYANQTNIETVFYSVYLGLGNVYSLNGNSVESIRYYKLALQELNELNTPQYKGYVLLNIVNEFLLLNNTDSTRYFLNQADTIFQSLEDPIGKSYVLGNRALLLAKNMKFDEANTSMQKCISILEESGSDYDIISFKLEMVKILIQNKGINLATEYALNAFKESFQHNLKEQIRDAAQLLSQIYSQQGDYQQAFEYQSTYLAYKDSISNDETIRKMANLRTEFEVSQKQQEIDILENKRLYSRFALLGGSVVLIILVVFLFFMRKTNKTIKKQRRRLIKQKSSLKELNATKDKMFSIISHDLRGPIHSLTGISPIMDELIVNKEYESLLALNTTMRNSLNQTSNLLDNLLEWSTNQQGNVRLKPERFNACIELNNLKEIFTYSALAKKITLEFHSQQPAFVYADKNTFATIIRNLLGNAIKFTREGGTVQLLCEARENKSCFIISDNGVGISPEKVSSLFDFKRTENTWGTNNEKGVGLGLRLAFDFTKLNNGQLTVESEEGKGTQFSVCLPTEK